jgi:hypothetical protein
MEVTGAKGQFAHWFGLARGLVPLESQQPTTDCGNRRYWPDRLPAAAAGLGDGEMTWKTKAAKQQQGENQIVETP